MNKKNTILSIENLEISFATYAGEVEAVRKISIDLYEGEVLAIVGESGCGKSVSFLSTIKLLPSPPAVYKGGKVMYKNKNLLDYTQREFEDIRGAEISVILQDPMSSLNPTMKIGNQITESILKHSKATKKEADEKAIEILELCGISNASSRLNQYPHEFSGGMRQRVSVAIALSCNPKILIADEPTTALDVTIQAQILDLLKDIKTKLNTSIVLITHDLGVVADMADRIGVMYAGKVVEIGTSHDIFYNPEHPYTWGLLKSIPKLTDDNKTELESIMGTPPDLFKPPVGCGFAARCEYAMKICYERQPPLFDCGVEHKSACWLKHKNAPDVTKLSRGGGETLE